MGPWWNLHQSCFPRSADSCFEIKFGVVYCPLDTMTKGSSFKLYIWRDFQVQKQKNEKMILSLKKLVFNVLIHALLDFGVFIFTLRISILRWKILVFGGNSRITGHQNMLGNLPHCHNCPLIPAEIKSCPFEFKGK